MTRFVQSRHLELEGQQGGEVVLMHRLRGTRMRLNGPTSKFLKLFERPRALEELASPAAVERARPVFERLQATGFLVPEGHDENPADKVVQRAPSGLFGCPALAPEGPAPDYALLGVPFDYGNHREPGARFGPDELRAASSELHFTYTEDPETGRGAGWYDNDLDRPVLDGATVADAGNLYVALGESPGHVFEKLRGVVAGLLARGSFPVVVGGDHSITYPVLAAFREPLAVFHLDAHSDLAPYHPGVENHHGNVMSRALTLDHVRTIYQAGLRGSTRLSQRRPTAKRALALSPRALREAGVEGLLAAVPDDLPLYVSVDIDALDPVVAPGTSTPVPGGLSFEEAKGVLVALGSRRRCVGFDLVEVNPRCDPSRRTAAVALELLLAFLGAHFGRRRGGHA